MQILSGGHTFDLVVLDLLMPNMDGFQLAKKIRDPHDNGGLGSNVPLVALTACTMKDERNKCLRAGMDGYLSKPFRAAELLAAIDRYGPRFPGSPPVDTGVAGGGAKRKARARVKPLPVLSPVADLAAGREQFFSQCPEAVTTLNEALNRRETARAEKAAERIKSAAVAAGANRVKNKAIRLRTAIQSEEWVRADSLYEELQKAYQEAVHCLNEKEEP